jgi:catechol 2,3-dioxygenase-like lactoylglutathione lyase family enzyme
MKNTGIRAFFIMFLCGLTFAAFPAVAGQKVPADIDTGTRIFGIQHVGLTVADIKKAAEFYTKVLGLVVEFPPDDWTGGEEFAKTIGVPGAILRAALIKIPKSGEMIELLEYKSPSSPVKEPLPLDAIGSMLIAYQVNDVDGMVKRLVAQHITVYPVPAKVNESGFFGGLKWAYFKDPLGKTHQIVGLASGGGGEPIVERIHHVGLTVKDIAKAIGFYQNVMSMEVDLLGGFTPWFEEDAKGVGVSSTALRLSVLNFGRKGQQLELREYKTPTPTPSEPLPPNALGAMHIAYDCEIDPLVDHLVQNGVTVYAVPANLIDDGPFQGLKWTYCKDPMGNTSELIGRVPGWKWK